MKTIRFYITKLKELVKFLWYLRFAKVTTNQNILIYGISRGGTTLLAETLVSLLEARLIWEPLFPYGDVRFNAVNPYSVKQYAKFELGWHPHIPCQDHQDINHYFDKYYDLKVRNIRFLRFTDHNRFSQSHFTVHKFCFGNFMYPYFQKRYAFKSVVLLRHPFAIAASSMGFGNNFDWHKKNYTTWQYKDTALSGEFFKQYEDKYPLIVSGFTLLVFQAVTQFSYVLEHLDHENTVVVYYEDLVLQPERAFKSLEALLQKPLDYKQFQELLLKQSFSSREGHTDKNALTQLSKWRQVISGQDLLDGLKIFEAFNFSLYSEDVLPLKTNTNHRTGHNDQ